MSRLLPLLTIASALALAGCPAEPADAPSPSPAASEAGVDSPAEETGDPVAADPPAETSTDAPAAEAKLYDVACGCSIEEVGHCGEYAKVDDAFVQITGDLGLGSMPFCGKKDLQAKIGGEMADGKLAATSIEIVE